MTNYPKISKALQDEHTGESVAIVLGEIIAFGKDSYEAEKKAIKSGYKKEDIMTTFIMGRKNYAL